MHKLYIYLEVQRTSNKRKRDEINHSLFIPFDRWLRLAKKLTPSSWTILKNYPKFHGLPRWPTIKWANFKKYYFK